VSGIYTPYFVPPGTVGTCSSRVSRGHVQVGEGTHVVWDFFILGPRGNKREGMGYIWFIPFIT